MMRLLVAVAALAVLAIAAGMAVAIVRGQPPAPPTTATSPTPRIPPPPARRLCLSCHRIGDEGFAVGPTLDGLATRMSAADVALWIDDPQAMRPGTTMPRIELARDERQALVEWLLTR